MGMCICTFMVPISACIGGAATGVANCLPCCVSPSSREQGSAPGGCCPSAVLAPQGKRRRLIVFAAMFAIGLIALYLPLTILCARADDSNGWMPYPTDGECWSTGGSMPYMTLGFFAGAFLGVGLAGFLLTVCWRTREAPEAFPSSPSAGGGAEEVEGGSVGDVENLKDFENVDTTALVSNDSS